jgi:hypothetical protein
MVDKIPNSFGKWAWYVPFVPFPLAETKSSLSVSCACSQQCGAWKLNECSSGFNIEVLIRNDLKPLTEIAARSAENEHVSDLRSGESQLYAAGLNAENSLKARTFTSESECAAASKEEVLKALLGVARGLVGNSWLLRDKSGSHNYGGAFPFR